MGINEICLEEARKELDELKNSQNIAINPIWKRFNDLTSRMSDDQQAFVNNSEKAVEKRQELMQTFNNWLFERFKNDFVKIPAFASLAEEYVNTIADVAQEFGQKTAGLAKENEELRRQIAELKAKQEDKLL